MVSVIIPARNEEASIARTVESVAAQPEVGEIIVVNDQSSDRTGEILAELATRTAKLKVLGVTELPAGWVGKNYAASIGAAAAQGDWLLFTDADTCHYPGSTRRALVDAVEHDAVLVSYSPEQELESFWERALIPYIYERLAARYSYARVNDPAESEAAANGQFLMILRDVYQSLGGHAAVCGDVLEDVALARRVKAARYRIHFAAPVGIVRTRMYRTFPAMWDGWTKNLYLLFGNSRWAIFREFAPWFVAALLLGPLVLISTHHGPPWMPLALFLGALVGEHAKYAAGLYRNLYPIGYIKYFIPGAILFSVVLIASWWKCTRGSVVWKGRAYPVRTT